ncbi:hypothetical protein Btru_016884 [Bulinus truncatus]|nr:hypothetical protein Btru_016884 [Bulinus truncatus]
MSLPLISSLDGPEVNYSSIKTLEDEDLDEMVKDIIRTNHATLHSLLSTPISQMYTQQDGIQVITLPSASEFLNMGLAGDVNDRLVHMVPTSADQNGLGTKYIGLIAIANPNILTNVKEMGFSGFESADNPDLHSASVEGMAAILMPPPPAPSDLPVNCPSWAMRLKKCERIGDSYRGYVENETELDVVLTQHKQQTNSFWGTRQSPSPAKASTRLMWKSQYVPFDGIPFVNAGSRAVVMECQFGPRRRGTLGKRGLPQNTPSEFKQTCPARIYIKKVRKFPSHSVNLNLDKKSIRLAMDKAFHELREQGLERWGEERYYVQLPTEKAHDYHDFHSKNDNVAVMTLEEAMSISDEQQLTQERSAEARIHPAVLEKIRQMVAGGETRLYTIRKQLRKFVLRELSQCTGQVPERHDLTMFPTVNDLKNHIHQALKDIESGLLPLTAPVVNLEVMPVGESNSEEQDSPDIKQDLCSLWADSSLSSGPMPETVTVTLTQNPDEDGHHIISRIETHLSDGTTQVSTTLTPETAQLLSRLHPSLFPAGSLLRLDTVHNNNSNEASSPNCVSDTGQEMSSMENSVTGLDGTMVTGVMSGHLTAMVDVDGSHISAILDSDSSLNVDHSSGQNIPGFIDPDNPNLASIVHSEPHLTNLSITGSGLSVLRAVDPATISEMVSTGAAHLSIVSRVPNTLALVTHKPETGGSMGFDSSDSDSNHLTLVEDDDHQEKLREQALGMARLEHKVSDL